MCGIAGFCDFTRDNDTPQWRTTAQTMADTLARRGPDDAGIFSSRCCVLAHRRLAVMDPLRGRQPMTRGRYTLVYNGEIYNTPQLRRELEREGYRFHTTSDTEAVLYACIEYGDQVAEHLEGIYAFALWDDKRKRLFCCRDRFGVKPLFYAVRGHTFLFGSELKALLAYPELTPEADDGTWQELLGISPARTEGCGVFAGISEVKPAHCLVWDGRRVKTWAYWQLESREHTDNYEDTVVRVRQLLTSAIRRQLPSDVPLCTLLSGGLDSSFITSVAAEAYREWGYEPLETYSFDYTDNEKFFTPSSFQPDADAPWVERMRLQCGTRHRVLTCPIGELCDRLDDAVAASDLPGMADVDSSLLYFCSQISRHHKVALSGECSDKIFGGYPWFQREEMLNAGTFPWCPDLSVRTAVLRPELVKRLHLPDYVQYRYEQSLYEMPRLEGESPLEQRRREVGWLNLHWFMLTLLNRKDRMSMYSGLEVRVPFCDRELVEYVFNIPWALKAKDGVRKQVLRDAAAGILPEDVRNRPKSPYPKTHNPLYEQLVRQRLTRVLEDKNAPLHAIVDEAALRQGLLADGGDYGKPWFGQLMAGPQMMAYLIQLNLWMERFSLCP